MAHDTRQQLLERGMAMLLRHGYHHLGIAALLEATRIPKGSFYHHFESKEEFARRVIDLYLTHVHAGLDEWLGNRKLPPLKRVRGFFGGANRVPGGPSNHKGTKARRESEEGKCRRCCV
jgi:TetR/AcrR family transcriptional repressor of nem operon